VVLGVGEGDIVAIVADLLHALLVNERPYESVIGALVVLVFQLSGARETGDGLGLLAVEGVEDGLHDVDGLAEALEEEAKDMLEDGAQGVEALLEAELDVEEGDVGAASRVRGELEEGLLLGDGVALLLVDGGQGLDELVA